MNTGKTVTLEGPGVKVTVDLLLEQLEPASSVGMVIPAGINAVRVKGTTRSWPLAYVDPLVIRNAFPAGRGTNELGFYTSRYGPRAEVNVYGWSVQICGDGTVGALCGPAPLAIPSDGGVLSGHDNGTGQAAADFVRSLKVGEELEFVTLDDRPPVIDPPPSSMGRPIIGEYLLDGRGTTADLSPLCNRLLVAFYQGTSLVEWGGQSPAEAAEDFTRWRISGDREVLVSLGGQGGTVDLAKVDEGIAKINHSLFPVDGIDFDNEAFGVSPQQALDVACATADRLDRAPRDFIVQFVPPGGSPTISALAAAKLCQKEGFRVYYGQQTYETKITDSDLINDKGSGAVDKAVAALGQESVLVGIMLNDRKGSWSSSDVARRLKVVKMKYPHIGGAYFWEATRKGTAAAATVAAQVLLGLQL